MVYLALIRVSFASRRVISDTTSTNRLQATSNFKFFSCLLRESSIVQGVVVCGFNQKEEETQHMLLYNSRKMEIQFTAESSERTKAKAGRLSDN